MIDLRASPATERFDRDGVGGQMMLAPIQIAGTGDGDALGHGIKASLTFKFLLKGFTTRFQQGDIGLTVVDHFLLEMEGHITTNLVSVPTGQFLFLFSHHAIGIVKLQIGDSTHVLLVVGGIVQMRKEPLLNSVKLKVLGKDASGMGKKHNESMNLRGPLLKDRTLAPTVSRSATSRCCWYSSWRINMPSKPFKL